MRDRLINFAMRAPSSVASRLRIVRLRVLGAEIGRNCWLRTISVPRNPWDISLSDNVALDDGVILLSSGKRKSTPRLRIEAGVYINRYTMIDVTEEITIGADSMIGPSAYITDHDHGTNLTEALGSQAMVSRPTRLGTNVWVGANAVILKGVTIGDNAIIAAGAVVTKDIPAQSIATGVPARARDRV